jgi:predicted  nucleic acid-binding Zn-ribbon protein
MPITRQLNDLEELDAAIERDEESLKQKQGQIGVRDVLDTARDRLTAARKNLDELKHRHREAEADVTDLLSKIAATEEQLYSGRIHNPKELTDLQREVNSLKSRSDQAETDTLAIIDQVETAENEAAAAAAEYDRLEEEWRFQQQQLTQKIEQLKLDLEGLNQKRQQAAAQVEPGALAMYEKVRQQKKPAVARVEQGICQACRISLSASQLQRARSGQPIQCGSCGRILYIS